MTSPQPTLLSQNRLERQCPRSSAVASRMHRRRRSSIAERNRRRRMRIREVHERIETAPIAFMSQRRPSPSSRHSFVGEASTGRWAMLKFKRHLLGREFTWITDCSGLIKFFESDYEATHTTHRWKLELLRFDFTTVHCPGRMLTDCDMLSRCDTVKKRLFLRNH